MMKKWSKIIIRSYRKSSVSSSNIHWLFAPFLSSAMVITSTSGWRFIFPSHITLTSSLMPIRDSSENKGERYFQRNCKKKCVTSFKVMQDIWSVIQMMQVLSIKIIKVVNIIQTMKWTHRNYSMTEFVKFHCKN